MFWSKEEVAKKPGIAYYDKNIISQIAEKSGLAPECRGILESGKCRIVSEKRLICICTCRAWYYRKISRIVRFFSLTFGGRHSGRCLFLSGNMVNRFTESASVSGTPLGLICSVFWIICKNSQRYEILSQKKWDWLFSQFLKATDRPVLNGS